MKLLGTQNQNTHLTQMVPLAQSQNDHALAETLVCLMDFFWWMTSVPPPIYSQGITREDLVKINEYQTVKLSENC